MEQHVHHGQRPGAAVELLTIEREVVGAHLAARLDEQGTRAARWIADARAGGALGQTSQQARDLLRCKKFSSLLSGVAGELLDKEHIGIADDVVVLEVRLVELQPLVREVDKQLFQSGVALLRFAEVAAVETDVAEDAAAVLAAQLFAVIVFKIRQTDVDLLSDIWIVAVLEEVVE